MAASQASEHQPLLFASRDAFMWRCAASFQLESSSMAVNVRRKTVGDQSVACIFPTPDRKAESTTIPGRSQPLSA